MTHNATTPVFLLLFVLGLGSCAKPPPQLPPRMGLCFQSIAPGLQPTDGHWAQLLTMGTGQTATHMCTRHTIEWDPPASDCLDPRATLPAPAPVPLAPGSVVERALPHDQRLVWVITHRFSNGDGFGPIALVRRYPDQLVVEAIGTLRLRRTRVQLEEWNIADGSLIVASGEHCADENDPGSCRRGSNVLVRQNHLLVSAPIRRLDGSCIDMPWIEWMQTADEQQPEGWVRHFEVRSSLAHDKRYLIVTEQVSVTDADPAHPEVAPREVRRIDQERFIHMQNGGLVTRQDPVWPKVLKVSGKTSLPTAQ